MGQAVTKCFTATALDAAKNAWGTVVQGVTAFAKWLEHEVKSLVTSVINSISDIVKGIKQFFINCWDSVEAFTRKILNLDQNLKDHVWGGVYKVGKGFVSAGIQHMRERLKELKYENIDGLTDDQIEKLWNEHMSKHPLTPEEKKAMDDTFPDDTDSGPSNMMSSTGVYSKFKSAHNVYDKV